MGQNWWWVAVLAIAVVALLVAAALLRARRRRAAAAAGDVGMPAAAADAGPADAPEPDAPGTAGGRSPDGEEPDTEASESGGTRSVRDEEHRASGATPRIPDQRSPEAADSALAALDSGLAGPSSAFVAAAAAVSAVTARPGPYPDSLLPTADGSAPSPDHPVKAHEGSRRYHTPDSPFYVRTRGDALFRTAEEARAAGFTAWNADR